jgi:N-acyl-L-homoserine lactone synthetase
MKIVSGSADDLPSDLVEQMLKYRYRVFVESLKWELASPDRREIDQFDTDQTLYTIAQDKDDEIIGVSRLLPTSEPYLLEQVFPNLLNGIAPPKRPDVWELSRFTTMDFNRRGQYSPGVGPRLSSQATLKFLEATIACAIDRGAVRLVTVSPLGIERLMRNAGLHVHRAGPPLISEGHPIFAYWIELDDEPVRLPTIAAINHSRRSDLTTSAISQV